jgi:putative addiction module killer protein
MSALKKIIIYKISSDKSPFLEWEKKLDAKVRGIVRTRIARLRLGNYGDVKSIKNGDGIYELRISFGAGYRIYFGQKGKLIIILLVGGDKSSQKRDIEKAKKYWLDYKDEYE